MRILIIFAFIMVLEIMLPILIECNGSSDQNDERRNFNDRDFEGRRERKRKARFIIEERITECGKSKRTDRQKCRDALQRICFDVIEKRMPFHDSMNFDMLDDNSNSNDNSRPRGFPSPPFFRQGHGHGHGGSNSNRCDCRNDQRTQYARVLIESGIDKCLNEENLERACYKSLKDACVLRNIIRDNNRHEDF